MISMYNTVTASRTQHKEKQSKQTKAYISACNIISDTADIKVKQFSELQHAF